MERFRLLALLVLSVFGSPLLAAPPNDSTSQAEEISGTAGILTGTTVGATHELGEPLLSGAETSAVWYVYTAPATGHVEISGIDPTTYVVIQGVLKTATGFEDLRIPSFGYQRYVMAVEEGKRYYIGISQAGLSTPGTFQLSWQFGNGGLIYLGHQVFNEDAGLVKIAVYREAPFQNHVEVSYEITPTNIQLEDVTLPAVRTVVFAPGEDTKYIDLVLHPDDLVEGRETFLITKLSATGGAFFTDLFNVEVTIEDADDDPPNDRPENAGVLTGTFGETKGTLAGANSEDTYSPNVYYRWTAPVTGTLLVTLRGPGWNTGYGRFIQVFEPRRKEQIFQQHPSDNSLVLDGQFEAIEGEAYTIVVIGYGEGEAGQFTLSYDMDRDADGLRDSGEATAGTIPTDADSDDDGLPDVAELRPSHDSDGDGLINGLDPDSDGDGLYDGTETGVAILGPGTDVGVGFFTADADAGATKTSMLLADTDGGGAADGYEDTNRNGAIEAGEANPNESGDDPLGQIRFRRTAYSGSEGSTITIDIDRIGNARGAASVRVSTSLLASRAGADLFDFIPQAVTLSFADGELGTRTIVVPLLDDALFEDAERFGISFSQATNAFIAEGSEAIVTIDNDDPYTASNGNYSGTFGALNSHVGAFGLKLTATGKFTGTLTYQHSRYPLRGRFGNDGTAIVTINRKGLVPLQVDLRVAGGGAFVEGTVREGASETGYELTGGRAAFSASNPALPGDLKSQKFTILLQPGEGTPAGYEGTGYAVGTLTSAGNLRIAGLLPDGSPFSAKGAMDADRSLSVQQVLYRGFGGLYGKLTVSTAGSSLEGELRWIRTPNPNRPEGFFSATINARGFAYVKPSRGELILAQLEQTNGAIALLLTPNGGEAPLRLHGVLASNHRLTDSNVPPMGLKGTANPATGLVRGSFQPEGGLKFTFSGVFVQETGTFEGLHPFAGSTGNVTSEPLLEAK